MKKLFTVSVFFYSPLILLANRGSDDYGIVLALMATLFSIPAGIILLGFIIYLIVLLNKKKKPEKKQGRVVFILSIIAIFLSIIIQFFWTYWADKHYEMFVLMSGAFVPIILLASISIILVRFVRKRAIKIDNDIIYEKQENIQFNVSNNSILRKYIWIILFIVLIGIIVLFKCFFVG